MASKTWHPSSYVGIILMALLVWALAGVVGRGAEGMRSILRHFDGKLEVSVIASNRCGGAEVFCDDVPVGRLRAADGDSIIEGRFRLPRTMKRLHLVTTAGDRLLPDVRTGATSGPLASDRMFDFDSTIFRQSRLFSVH